MEETAVEYGALRERKNILTASSAFWDDGVKVKQSTLSVGFSQLDVTSLYLLVRAAAAKAGPAQPDVFQGAAVHRIAVDRQRSERRLDVLKIEDKFDVYVSQSGQLTGIGRSVYPKTSPQHYTMAYAFSDYRDVGGVLLPFKVMLYLSNRLAETITVESYRFDVSADPAFFRPKTRLP
jgi:hypothetical protein